MLTRTSSTMCMLLHIAAEAGQPEIVQYLPDEKPELVEKTGGDLRLTPLHLAAMNSRMEVIFAILDQKSRAIEQIMSARENIFHLIVTNGLDYKLWSTSQEAPDEQLHGVLNMTIVAIVHIATLTFSTLLNLPGGVYQEGLLAGRTILSTHPLFPAFLAFNMVVLPNTLVIVVTQSSSVAFTRDGLIYLWVVLDTIGCIHYLCVDGLPDCCLDDVMFLKFFCQVSFGQVTPRPVGLSASANIVHHVCLHVLSSKAEEVKIGGLSQIHPHFGNKERLDKECIEATKVSDMLWQLILPVGSNRDHIASNFRRLRMG
ncbi:hypothetical protein EJ110_NYTH45721 [Nymphaea thermarum]|nr:hypothetical protein EJ110_NYTH45721 [Nymphaea thermarum]